MFLNIFQDKSEGTGVTQCSILMILHRLPRCFAFEMALSHFKIDMQCNMVKLKYHNHKQYARIYVTLFILFYRQSPHSVSTPWDLMNVFILFLNI